MAERRIVDIDGQQHQGGLFWLLKMRVLLLESCFFSFFFFNFISERLFFGGHGRGGRNRFHQADFE